MKSPKYYQKQYINIQKVRITTHEMFMKEGAAIGGDFRVIFTPDGKKWTVKIGVFNDDTHKGFISTPVMTVKPNSVKAKKTIRKVVRKAIKVHSQVV
jgi:hypothetical protein